MKKKPRILLVGNGDEIQSLERALSRLRVKCVHTRLHGDEDDGAPAASPDEYIAIILVARDAGWRTMRLVTDLNVGTDLALVVIVADGASESVVRRFYTGGATAVFEWPREHDTLARSLAEILAVDMVRGAASGPDRALARRSRAHLRASHAFAQGVKVDVSDGVVFLSGEVNHLWQKAQIEKTASDIPGAKGLVSGALIVAPTQIPDAELRQRIRRVIRDSSQHDETTLAIDVSRGHVTIAGSLSDREEMDHLTEIVTNILGVRGIERFAIISEEERQLDSVVARRLNGRLSRAFPDEQVKASFFGGAAVLYGRVSSLSAAKRIGRIVDSDPSVERVISKLEVR